MSAAMDSNIGTIFVELLNEGTFVLRPTTGEAVSEGKFRLNVTSDYDPDLETWRFTPGTIVVCEWEEHDGELLLVAKAQAA